MPTDIYLLYQLQIQSDFALSAPAFRSSGLPTRDAVPLVDDREYHYEFVRADWSSPRPFELSEQTRRYHSQQSGADLHVAGTEICLHYSEIADFYFDGAKRVTCFVAAGAAESLLVSLLQGPVTIESLSARDGLVEMLRFSFCAGALGPLGLAASRFHELGRIAEIVRIRRLCYESGFQNVQAVVDAVLYDASS